LRSQIAIALFIDREEDWTKYCALENFEKARIESNALEKEINTIVEKWPYKFVQSGDFQLLKVDFKSKFSFYYGVERYMEWKRAAGAEKSNSNKLNWFKPS